MGRSMHFSFRTNLAKYTDMYYKYLRCCCISLCLFHLARLSGTKALYLNVNPHYYYLKHPSYNGFICCCGESFSSLALSPITALMRFILITFEYCFNIITTQVVRHHCPLFSKSEVMEVCPFLTISILFVYPMATDYVNCIISHYIFCCMVP